ncbi:DUF3726 domain-containing protein [Dongia deserti]|uniref:DUF3726 domain-containing protein n=1 Tax=Dongia deserti TaxID=2268030 RepID=UPI0025482B0D|nr:DUF3726 domain-containing protein [Dongia deserti]
MFSISEIQAVCLKAARGSGLPWGLAEEVGAGAAWLTAAGFPGPELVLQLLQAPPGEPPTVGPGKWRAAQGELLCPIKAGAALSDFAALPEGIGAGKLTMLEVAFPLLVLPFAALVARGMQRPVRVHWHGFDAVLAPDGYWISASVQGAELAQQATVVLVCEGTIHSLAQLGCSGRRVPLDVWRRLDDLAMLTTVPATARSHVDAGAAASDND